MNTELSSWYTNITSWWKFMLLIYIVDWSLLSIFSPFLGQRAPCLGKRGKTLENDGLSSASAPPVNQINLGPSEPKSSLLLDEDVFQFSDGCLWELIELMNVKFLAHTGYFTRIGFVFYSMLNVIHVWKKLATLSPFSFFWAPRLNSTPSWILALFLFPSSHSSELYNTHVQLIQWFLLS